MAELIEIAESLIEGQENRVEELIRMALDEGIDAGDIMSDGLLAGMDVVGKRFKEADMFIPEVMLSANAMIAGMDILKPLLFESSTQGLGKIVLGTVSRDVHKIGKNLVGIMLTGVGFDVIDLGEAVPPERFVESVIQEKAQLVAMSALLTMTMPFMKDTIDALKEAGLENRIKTLVGGATVTQKFADDIGADGYAPDAVSAAQKAKELLNLN